MPSLFNKSSTEKQKRSKLLDIARRTVKIFNSQIIPMEMIYSQKQPKIGKLVKAEKLTEPQHPMQFEESSRKVPLSRRVSTKGGKRKSRKARRSMKSRK